MDIWDLLGDAVRLEGEANLDDWSEDIAHRLNTAGLGRFLDNSEDSCGGNKNDTPPPSTEPDTLAQWHTDRTQAKMAILVTTAPVSDRLAAAGYQHENDAFESPRYLYDFVRTRVFTDSSPATGRQLLRKLKSIHLHAYDDSVGAFAQALEDLCARLDRHGAPQTDVAKIWTCLNALDEVDPGWPLQWKGGDDAHAENDNGQTRTPDEYQTNKATITVPMGMTDWEAYTSWKEFRRDLVRGFGERKVVNAAKPAVASPIPDDWVKVESSDQEEGEAVVVEAEAVTDLLKGVTLNEGPAKETAPKKAALKEETSKETTPKGGIPIVPIEVASKEATSKGVASLETIPKPLSKKAKARARAKAKKKKALPPIVKDARPLAKDDALSTAEVDVSPAPAEDGVRTAVKREVLYPSPDLSSFSAPSIPSMPSTPPPPPVAAPQRTFLYKKPKRRLKDAKKKHQRAFFHAKFPGCAKCELCRCPHPPQNYDYCSNCGFCHKGGEVVCYDQNPELREVMLAERAALREANGYGGLKTSLRKKGPKKGPRKEKAKDPETSHEADGWDADDDDGYEGSGDIVKREADRGKARKELHMDMLSQTGNGSAPDSAAYDS